MFDPSKPFEVEEIKAPVEEPVVEEPTKKGLKAFKDEDFPEYQALVRNPETTSAQLEGWLNDKGYGDTVNAGEVIDFVRKNPNALIDNNLVVDEPAALPDTPAPAPERSVGESLGLGARGLVTGAGGLVDLVANPVNQLINALPGEQGLSQSPFRDLGEALSNKLGFPIPETDLEKIANSINEGGIQALMTFGAGSALSGAKGATGEIGKLLSNSLAVETAGSIGANVAGEKARQEGASPIVQVLASLAAGGVSGATMAGIVKGLSKTAVKPSLEGSPVEPLRPNTKLVDDKSPTFNDNKPIETLTPANDSGAPAIRREVEKPGAYALDKPTKQSTGDRIDQLDELMANSDKNDPRQQNWADEQDKLMAEDAIKRDGQIPRNDNVPQTSQQKLREAESAYTDKAFGDDPRSYADRRTKDRKAYETELAALEAKYTQAASDHFKTLPEDELSQIVKTSEGRGTPYDEAARVEAARREELSSTEVTVESIARDNGKTPPDTDKPDVVSRLTEALKSAGKASAEQTALYKAERAKRFAAVKAAQTSGKGKQAYTDSLGLLKGALPKADFEDVSKNFTQSDVDELFDVVTNTKTLTESGKLSAYKGLADILEGRVPQPKSLEHMNEAFPADFVKTVLANRSKVAQSFSAAGEVWNLPKSLMATADLSAPFRQGLGLIHTKSFWSSFSKMFKYAVSKKAVDNLDTHIKTHPNYALAEESGLSITTTGKVGPTEDMFSSHLAEKIPVMKYVVQGAERAYVGFLNKLRFDTFNHLVDKARQADPDLDIDGIKGISRYINVMTGRGGLGKAEPAAEVLNAGLFSARLISSRLQMLAGPAQALAGRGYIADLPTGLKREAAKSYAGIIGSYTTVAGLASLAGYQIEADPRSSDFGKIRDGNIRLDVGGGLVQYITAGTRAIMRTSKSSTSGNVRELTRQGDTPLDTDIKFILNKAHPSLSLFIDQQRGSDAIGEEFGWGKAIINRLIPMGIPDIVQVLEEKGTPGMFYGVMAILGHGLQVYESKDKTKFDPTQKFEVGAPTKSEKSGFDPSKPFEEEVPAFDPSKSFEETTSANVNAKDILEGMGFRITDSGVRSDAKQAEYYKTTSGVAKPGYSPHQSGNAVDIGIPKDAAPSDIVSEMENAGYQGVTVVTKRHGTGPHWHVQWEYYGGNG